MLALLLVSPPPTNAPTGGSKVGAILGLFTSAVPFGGAIIAALLLVCAGIWGYERIEISGLNKEITTLHGQIDGPTGYIQQIGRANANLAVANANITDLTKAVADERAQIDKLATDSMAAVKRTQALSVALADAQARARSVAQVLAAQRPQTASYAALAGLIKQPVMP